MKVLSFFGIKGGIAKSVSSLAFAQILHDDYSKRVLLIDIDKQASSSKTLGCYTPNGLTSADLLTAKDVIIEKVIRHSEYGIDVIPANFELIRANKEVLLDTLHPQQLRFKRQLEAIRDKYDYCIIDYPIDDNMAVINALVVTDDVLVPIKMERYALDGMEYVIDTIENIQGFNPNIQLKGCFATMYVRSNLYKEGMNALSDSLGLKFLKTPIRQTVKVGESTFEKPLMSYAPNCSAAEDYKKLVAEYLSLE